MAIAREFVVDLVDMGGVVGIGWKQDDGLRNAIRLSHEDARKLHGALEAVLGAGGCKRCGWRVSLRDGLCMHCRTSATWPKDSEPDGA